MHILFENYVKWSVNAFVTKIFSRLNEYTSPKLSDIEYFLTTSPHHGGISHVTKLSLHKLQENSMPKNILLRCLSGTDWERGSKNLLKGMGVDQRREWNCLKKGGSINFSGC